MASMAHIQWNEDTSLPEGWKTAPYTVLKGKYSRTQLYRCHVIFFLLYPLLPTEQSQVPAPAGAVP